MLYLLFLYSMNEQMPYAFLERLVRQWIQPTIEEWEAFCNCLEERTIKKNEVYLAEGAVCHKSAFVAQGSFRMYYLIEGEERCKDFQFEGQFTGSLYSLLTGNPALFSISAMEDSLLLELSRDNLFTLYDQYKIWERFGRIYMEQLFIYKEKREASLLFETAAARYQNMLMQQPQHLQRIPQKYLASYLGIKPESLSRLRRQFAEIQSGR